jgi:hypothetical protein
VIRRLPIIDDYILLWFLLNEFYVASEYYYHRLYFVAIIYIAIIFIWAEGWGSWEMREGIIWGEINDI